MDPTKKIKTEDSALETLKRYTNIVADTG